MEKYFPKEKLIVTGNPVRNTIVLDAAKKADAYTFFGFDSGKKTILLTGGSLGARTLNEAMLAGLDRFVEEGIQVIWQTGGFYFEEMKRRTEGKNLTGVKMVDFLREMDMAYAVADVVIARAGALSIAELELTGKASILIPSPNVAEDHQTLNAKALEQRGAALLMKDSEAIELLHRVVPSLLNDTGRLEELQRNIKELARPNASKTIANEIISMIK